MQDNGQAARCGSRATDDSREKYKKSLIFSALTILLAGCAVRTDPLSDVEVRDHVASVTSRMTAGQEPFGQRIDLHEAMARALKYNLDARVAAFEEMLRIEESRLATMDMLPRLVANGASTSRDSQAASSSRSVLTGRQSLEPSTSQERDSLTADLTFSYNVLDFGLSYLRATQAADRALIAEENRRKVANRILEDVRTAYWRAVAADRLAARLPAMEARIGQVQRANRALRLAGQTSPIAALTFEREVIDLQRELRRMETELATARGQLAALMNIAPGTPFRLADPSRGRRNLALPGNSTQMVQSALMNRAEVRELMLQKRINETEAKAALVELLPGIQAFVGGNVDQNSFLVKNNWIGWGVRASWNVINLVRYPQKAETIAANDRVIDQKAMAGAMAVMTQVHASRVRFQHTGKEMQVAEAYLGVQRQLLHQVRAEAASGRSSDQTVLREEMNQLIAGVRADLAYANWQNAYANVFASIGVDPYAGTADRDLPVSALAGQLKTGWFERGDARGRLNRNPG